MLPVEKRCGYVLSQVPTSRWVVVALCCGISLSGGGKWASFSSDYLPLCVFCHPNFFAILSRNHWKTNK